MLVCVHNLFVVADANAHSFMSHKKGARGELVR